MSAARFVGMFFTADGAQMTSLSRSVLIGAVCGAWAAALGAEVELKYSVPADVILTTTMEEEAEFWAVGDIPGFDKVEGSWKTAGQRRARVLDVDSDKGFRMQANARYETMITINDSPWNLEVNQIGPVQVLMDFHGRVLEMKSPPFEAKLRNLMKFEWIDYLANQMYLPLILPGRKTKPGDTWTNELQLVSPAGGFLTMKQTSKLVGRNVGRRAGWWLHTVGVLPMKLQFDTFVGPYRADGEVRMHTISLFDPKAGFVVDRTSSMTISMDVSLEPAPDRQTVGQPFNAHMLIYAKDRLNTEGEPAGQAPARQPADNNAKPKAQSHARYHPFIGVVNPGVRSRRSQASSQEDGG